MKQKQQSWLARMQQWIGGQPVKKTVFAGDDLQHSLEALRRGEAVLVDVREASEWEQGHVPGALLLPLSRLQTPAEHKSIQANWTAPQLRFELSASAWEFWTYWS